MKLDPEPKTRYHDIAHQLAQRGVSQREFLRFRAMMTAAPALPQHYVGKVAAAVAGVIGRSRGR